MVDSVFLKMGIGGVMPAAVDDESKSSTVGGGNFQIFLEVPHPKNWGEEIPT